MSAIQGFFDLLSSLGESPLGKILIGLSISSIRRSISTC